MIDQAIGYNTAYLIAVFLTTVFVDMKNINEGVRKRIPPLLFDRFLEVITASLHPVPDRGSVRGLFPSVFPDFKAYLIVPLVHVKCADFACWRVQVSGMIKISG